MDYDSNLLATVTLAELYDSAFNEAEALTSTLYVPEPAFEKVVVKEHTRKQKGKRESDLEDFPVEVINHELSEEKLHEIFGDSWKTLLDEVYKRLRYQIKWGKQTMTRLNSVFIKDWVKNLKSECIVDAGHNYLLVIDCSEYPMLSIYSD